MPLARSFPPLVRYYPTAELNSPQSHTNSSGNPDVHPRLSIYGIDSARLSSPRLGSGNPSKLVFISFVECVSLLFIKLVLGADPNNLPSKPPVDPNFCVTAASTKFRTSCSFLSALKRSCSCLAICATLSMSCESLTSQLNSLFLVFLVEEQLSCDKNIVVGMNSRSSPNSRALSSDV